MIVGVYVDDLLVGGSEKDCESLLASLNKKFPANNLGRVHMVRWMWHRKRC